MKKTLAMLLAALMLASSFVGCEKKDPVPGTTEVSTESAEERAQKYAAAVAALEDDVLTEKGQYTMSEDLITALEYAEFTAPKNIILMIGDGMGFNQIESAQAAYVDDLYNGKMAWNYLPMVSSQSSSSASAMVTDSAAGGTALSTGYRTTNGVLAMDMEAEESYKTVLELAAEKGKSTGIIATKNVTDATPASFTAHVNDRSEELEIASQQADKLADGSLDLVLGGGARFYDRNRDNVTETLANAGVTYTKDFAEATAAELPLVGLFENEELITTDPSTPTIAEMTDIALRKLSKDENGFFIMIEGSQIDSYGHGSDINGQMKETYDFDSAIAVALRFAAMNPDTVIIITADHETGGLILPAEPTKDNVDEFTHTSGGAHTQTNVPVLAIGHGVEALEGINHNTDVARFIASLMGEENFGQEKKVHTILDTSIEENVKGVVDANSAMATAAGDAIAAKFDATNTTLSISADLFDTPMSEVKMGTRTIVMNIKNTGDTPIVPPAITLTTPSREITSDEVYTIIMPGETKRVVYVLDYVCWNPSRLLNMSSITLGYAEGETASLEISDVFLTERPLDK
ncbi:MAG: alkaline phosphatase [Clostridia bacterium]|nr:alkaline phosphatase [Clostridia bacterium]